MIIQGDNGTQTIMTCMAELTYSHMSKFSINCLALGMKMYYFLSSEFIKNVEF